LGADIVLFRNMFLRAVVMGGIIPFIGSNGPFALRAGVGWVL